MAITLTPGYRANVQLRDTSNNVLYQCNYATEEQIKEFIGRYANSRDGYSLLQGVSKRLT